MSFHVPEASRVTDGPMGPGCSEYCGHPTQKNFGVMRWLLRKTHGAVIVDPFMGTGTTLAAAKRDRRRAIGIEIDERYCAIAIERLSQEILPLEMVW